MTERIAAREGLGRARRRLCASALVGYLLTVPVVGIFGWFAILVIMGDTPSGQRRSHWEPVIVVVCLSVFSTMGPLLFRSIPPQGPARVTR